MFSKNIKKKRQRLCLLAWAIVGLRGSFTGHPFSPNFLVHSPAFLKRKQPVARAFLVEQAMQPIIPEMSPDTTYGLAWTLWAALLQ